MHQLTSTANSAQFTMAGLAVLVSWQILKGSHDYIINRVSKLTSPLPSIFMLIYDIYDCLGGMIYDKNLTTACISQISQLTRKVGLFSTIQEVHNKFKNYKYSQIHFKLLNTDTLLPGICLASLNLKSKKPIFQVLSYVRETIHLCPVHLIFKVF